MLAGVPAEIWIKHLLNTSLMQFSPPRHKTWLLQRGAKSKGEKKFMSSLWSKWHLYYGTEELKKHYIQDNQSGISWL
jgi:hypothetical protein